MRAPRVITVADVGRYWDAAAANFDDWLSPDDRAVAGYSDAEAQAWARAWRRAIGPPPRRVLDVGTGTGSVGLLLAARGYEVTGVDGSAPMLERAEAKARSGGLAVDWRQGTAEHLPFADGAFDAVVAKLVLWTLIEPEAAVAEWRRCTRAGGRVAAADISYDRMSGLDRVRLAVARRRSADPAAGYLHDPERLAQLPLWMAGAGAYANVFGRAGLTDIRCDDLRGLAHLERRRLPAARRLWPVLPRHLVEGTVPAGGPSLPNSKGADS